MREKELEREREYGLESSTLETCERGREAIEYGLSTFDARRVERAYDTELERELEKGFLFAMES